VSNAKLQEIDLLKLIIRPVVTEKAMQLVANQQYVFEVNTKANKIELAKAFKLLFPGREVRAVRLIPVPPKTKRMGRTVSLKKERRKAIFTITGDPLDMFPGV
jgi:large subunit ribosomal protein L23